MKKIKRKFIIFVYRIWSVVLFRFRCSENICFTYHLGTWCEPGRIYKRDNKRWVIKKIKREIDVGLINGGRIPCWSLWGKRIDNLPISKILSKK